jgi:hypothetical protein
VSHPNDKIGPGPREKRHVVRKDKKELLARITATEKIVILPYKLQPYGPNYRH